MDWFQIKDAIEHFTGLDQDSLHVHAGVLGQLAAAWVLRRPVRSALPWLLVLAAAAANEMYDYHYEIWPDRGIQLEGGLRDVWNTMLLPSVILLAARFHPRLFKGAPVETESSAPDPG